MTKRISCRVVSSVALAESSGESPHSDNLNTINSSSSDKVHISNLEPSTYTGRMNVTQAALKSAPIGLFLDFYA